MRVTKNICDAGAFRPTQGSEYPSEASDFCQRQSGQITLFQDQQIENKVVNSRGFGSEVLETSLAR